MIKTTMIAPSGGHASSGTTGLIPDADRMPGVKKFTGAGQTSHAGAKDKGMHDEKNPRLMSRSWTLRLLVTVSYAAARRRLGTIKTQPLDEAANRR